MMGAIGAALLAKEATKEKQKPISGFAVSLQIIRRAVLNAKAVPTTVRLLTSPQMVIAGSLGRALRKMGYSAANENRLKRKRYRGVFLRIEN